MKTIEELSKGLQILSKYDTSYVAAEHDMIYVGPINISTVTEEDSNKLKELGFHIDSQTGSWAYMT